MSLRNKFLGGDKDLWDAIQVLNNGVDNVDKYTALNPNLVSYSTIRSVVRTNGQIEHLKSLWFSNVGRNGVSVKIERELSERTKESIQRRLYSFAFDDMDWGRVKRELLSMMFEEGNAIVRLHKEKGQTDRIIVESLEKWNVYKDPDTHVIRYHRKIKGGAEDPIPQYHKQDIFHFKDPHFEHWAVAPARINLAYAYLVMEMHGVKANANLFSKGGIGLTILSLNEQASDLLNENEDEQGETGLSKWLKETWDKITGTRNANTIRSIPGLDKVFEIGKDNKSMQFVDLIGTIAPEKIAWAWNITLADLGSGDNTTYNNTQTFSYVLYEKIGRQLEESLDELLNNWLLQKYGFPTSIYGDVHMMHDKPSNPDRIAYQEQSRLDWTNNAITLNEYRDSQDLPPIEGGDVFFNEWTSMTLSLPETESDPNTVEGELVQNKLTYAKESLTEKALKSKDFTSKKKGFLVKWQKAYTSQLNDFVKQLESDDPSDLSEYEVKLKPIESYYSFPNLKKDLGKFAKLGVEDFNKDKRIKFKKVEYLETGFPDIIDKMLEFRTILLLKGMTEAEAEIDNPLISFWMGIKGFVGLDEETAKQIKTFISKNSTKSVPDLIKGLQERVEDMSYYRAEAIARTEVSNAIEGSRYIMYQEEFGVNATSEWETAGDERVGDDHEKNDGEIRKLGDEFPSGETRVGQRVNCRCSSTIRPPEDY